MSRYVIGDIHGEHDKLISCLQQVNFDYKNDTLIQLGDVVDRGAKSFECVEELLKIENLIAVKGNHDDEFFTAYQLGEANTLFTQGGSTTHASYLTHCLATKYYPFFKMPDEHYNFFVKQVLYVMDEDKNLFIHGGFNRHSPIKTQRSNVFMWDRDLWLAALSFKQMKNNEHKFKIKDGFNKIFIGHTPTIYWNTTTPMQAANIWNLDTGCGKGAYPLTIMNIDTEQFWQSEKNN